MYILLQASTHSKNNMCIIIIKKGQQCNSHLEKNIIGLETFDRITFVT